jgi:hypothetical protein
MKLATSLVASVLLYFNLAEPMKRSTECFPPLSDKADSLAVYQIPNDEKYCELMHEIRVLSKELDVPSAWLSAIIHFETAGTFRKDIRNRKSGAIGYIQFMPTTLKEMGITPDHISKYTTQEQFFYVGKYFERHRRNYEFEEFIDLYLAVIYPAARKWYRYDMNGIKRSVLNYDHVLFRRGSIQYRQNKGLDWDNDGLVTIDDIDQILFDRYPGAYAAKKQYRPNAVEIGNIGDFNFEKLDK